MTAPRLTSEYPIDVIVSGHLCLDLFPRMDNVPQAALTQPGHLIETGPLELSTGGAVSNVGLALNRLGANVRLMATVGDDLIGRATIDFVNQRDPSLSQFIRLESGAPSSYTVVLAPARADRTFLHCAGVNGNFGLANVDFAQLGQAKIFYLGYPPLLPRLLLDDGAEVEAIYQRAKATGIVTALDMALPDPAGPSGRTDWPLLIRRTLPFVDIFVPSIEEILYMLRRADYERWQGAVLAHLTLDYLSDLAGELIEMGALIAGFKLGERGMYLRCAAGVALARLERIALDLTAWSGAQVYSPAFQVQVAGTTGAGDSAYGGLLLALLRGLGPAAALQMACAVGACNVEAVDATSGIRTWKATQARIAAGWPSRPEQLA